MKDNFLKLGILGGRDVLFDTSIFSFYFLIKHVSRKVFTMATDGKKMKYYFQTAYFSINVNNRTWLSLYRASKFVSIKFFQLFYKFTREAWLP